MQLINILYYTPRALEDFVWLHGYFLPIMRGRKVTCVFSCDAVSNKVTYPCMVVLYVSSINILSMSTTFLFRELSIRSETNGPTDQEKTETGPDSSIRMENNNARTYNGST
jgi:hypothetical protein